MLTLNLNSAAITTFLLGLSEACLNFLVGKGKEGQKSKEPRETPKARLGLVRPTGGTIRRTKIVMMMIVMVNVEEVEEITHLWSLRSWTRFEQTSTPLTANSLTDAILALA